MHLTHFELVTWTKRSLPRLLLPPAAFGLGGSACTVTVSINALRIQSVYAVSLASWMIVRTVDGFSPAASFPLPAFAKAACMIEPTAEIKTRRPAMRYDGLCPLVDIKMELSSLSSLCLRARNIHYLGEAAQLPLPQKRIAKNNRRRG